MAAKPGRITEEIINAEYQAVYHYILSLCRDEKEAEESRRHYTGYLCKSHIGRELPGREQLLFLAVLYRQKYMDRQVSALRQDPV